MKKYQINDRVFAFNKGGYTIPGTITAKDSSMYRVEYDCGGYDWLIADEIRPLEYHVGDYVKSLDGVGKVVSVNEFFMGIIEVSYGKHNIKGYYENELAPMPKPSLWARIFKQGVYLFD